MAQKRDGSPTFDDNAKRPAIGANTDKPKDELNPPPPGQSDILRQLLEGQQNMSRDLRESLKIQSQHGSDIESAKSNVFTLGRRLGDVFNQQHEIIDALDYNNHEVQDLREKVISTAEKCKDNEKNQSEIATALNKINERLDILERAQLEMSTELRAKSIVISGLNEIPDENAHQVVYNFLLNIEPSLKYEDIDICYRMGPNQLAGSSVSRNMMAMFMGLGKKQLIMKKKNSLRKNTAHQNIYLNDDLPQTTREIRETLREISKYAGEKGYKTKVSGSKLVVEGKTYHPHELDFLPTDIHPEKVKTRRRGDGIAFQGPTSILSNLYPCNLTIQGIKYNCAEQVYAYRKGIWCKREDLAHKVMLLSLPKEIKKAGDNMPVDQTWEREKVSVMEEIVHHKFFQNKDLARKLCDTGELPLYEATTNTFWGCGLRINSRLWLSGNPPGQNRLGLLLMDVRSKLMDRHEFKHATTTSSAMALPLQHSDFNQGKSSTYTTSQNQMTEGLSQESPTGEGELPLAPSNAIEERNLPSSPVITSTPSANTPAAGAAPVTEQLEYMDTDKQVSDAEAPDTNLSINNESSLSSEMNTNYRDISTDGIFDLKKIESWSLRSIQRRTAELHRKVNMAKRRSSQFVAGRVTKPTSGNTSLPPQSQSEEGVPRSLQPRYRDRSFTNSNLKKGVLENMGFDANSDFIQSIANINNENINDRRRSKPKS